MELTGTRLGDESFTLGGTTYHMLFPHSGGAQGFVSVSPFAPKTQIGPRSYADYNAYSAVAFTDFSGGMGQDRISDPTRYYDAHGVDTRSGRLILGPHATESANAGVTNAAGSGDPAVNSTSLGIVDGNTAIATKIVGAGQVLYRVWLLLKAEIDAKNICIVSIYSDKDNKPDKHLVYCGVPNTHIRQYGTWIRADLSAPVTLENGKIYWLAIRQQTPGPKPIYWYGSPLTPGQNIQTLVLRNNVWTTRWVAPFFWIEDDESRPAAPGRLLSGVGKDGVARLWYVAGRKLFYLDENGAPTPVKDGASVKDFTGPAECAAWYRSSGDTHAFLYIGLGDSVGFVQKFDGNIGNEVWTTPGVSARAMCVHEDLLWLAYARNTVAGWDSSTLGNAVKVGDSTYPVRNMVSWGGDLWVGKDDGLYRVTTPIGYPTTGDPVAQKIIDLSVQASDVNFCAMCEHHGDLYFSVAQGLMRYTAGGVLTSIGPETGLNLAAATRSTCRALASSLNVLWATFEAPFGEYTSLLAYIEGHWHPLVSLPRSGDMARSIAIEPGWYGDSPRVWYNSGLAVSYFAMPMTSQRRWLFDGPDITYTVEGYLDTSWIDGGVRTVLKDWIDVEIDATNLYIEMLKLSSVSIFWRPDEETPWIFLGDTYTPGVTRISFPTDSHSHKAQLRIILRSLWDIYKTPIVEAVIVRYMERPQDVRSFTRTYEFSSRQNWRNGAPVLESLATRLNWLRTLREAVEPLTWTDWLGETRKVHIVRYSASLSVEARGEQDTGTVIVTLELQEV